MNARQFFVVLRARWLVVLAVVALVAGTTAVVSLLLPRQYKATASVVIDVKPDPVSAMVYGALATPSLLATQVDIIRSERVARRVARDLKLADNDDVRAQWRASAAGQGSAEQWVAENLQRNLDVQPSRESNVITVTYKAPDARFAAAMANAFVQATVETALELRVDPARQYSSFFEQRAREAREALEAAQARLSRFQKEQGILATDERLDVENARLNELSTQLVSVQALAAESSSRERQAQGASGERMQEVLANPLISGLKADLSRAEAKLREIGQRLGDRHPQVVEARASIDELERRIAEETRRVTGGVGVTGTINRQREAQLRAELENQRAKLLRMKAVRDEGAVLVRDVENAQRSYDTVLARLTQTSLESQTTQSNVNLLTAATPPLTHASPRLALNLLVALFVGTLLGVGAAVALEALDRRVRSAEDLAAALELPVLGVLPAPRRRVAALPRARRSMKERLVRPQLGAR